MSTPSTRMLDLLSLLQDGRDWSGAELAERLGSSTRTLRRDLDRLRELGYPVQSKTGPAGSYRLVAGRAMPPLLLTDDEAVAVTVGLRFAALAQVAGDDGAAEAALRKLEQVLPARLQQRLHAVVASTGAVPRPAGRLDMATVQSLASAAHDHLDVRFRYIARAGRATRRRVEPYRQVLVGRHWYLLGWDVDRGDWRTFRLDRISELQTPGTTFRPRELPAEGVDSFVAEYAREPIHRHRGVVRFGAPIAVVSERLMAEAGTLEAIDEHSCRFVSAPDSFEWLAITLAMVGVPYVIEGPQGLLDMSRELAKRIERACT